MDGLISSTQGALSQSARIPLNMGHVDPVALIDERIKVRHHVCDAMSDLSDEATAEADKSDIALTHACYGRWVIKILLPIVHMYNTQSAAVCTVLIMYTTKIAVQEYRLAMKMMVLFLDSLFSTTCVVGK